MNQRKTMNMAPTTAPWDVPEPALRMALSILDREQSGAISAKSAQMAIAQLFPSLDSVKVVPPFNLDDVPEPSTPAAYNRAMGMIWRAAVNGRVGLKDAQRAMISTRKRFRARPKTTHG